MSATIRDRVLRLVKHGFVRLPWASKALTPEKATDETFLMKDLGFHPDDYADFIEEFASEFSILEPIPPFPKDERVSTFYNIAELKQWPKSWHA